MESQNLNMKMYLYVCTKLLVDQMNYVLVAYS